MYDKIRIKGETDKRVNIYRIWDGKQLILCKNSDTRKTHFNNKDWVVLFPAISQNDEKRMIYGEPAIQKTDFVLSDAGKQYLGTILNESREIKYIAEVEYVRVNGLSRRLWESLEKIHEFELWDIDNGPLKYYVGKNQQFIAIYRVYVMSFNIDRMRDQDLDINGNQQRKKQLTSEVSEKIFNSISRLTPIVDDEAFQKRREAILKIIRETRYDSPDMAICKKIKTDNNEGYKIVDTINSAHQTSETKIINDMNYGDSNNSEDNPKKIEDEQNKKFCIFCGTELMKIAIFCSRCGKKQVGF